MKRILLIFAALMALGGVKAAEYTTVEQLTENYFQLVVNDGGTYKSLYISGDGWDLTFGNTTEVVNSSECYYLFKAVLDGDKYILNCYNYAGDKRSSHMGDAVNITTNSLGLFIGTSEGANGHSKGQDKDNGGRWTITAVSGGFTFQNAGDNYYISISPSLTSSSTATLMCLDKDEFRAAPRTFTTIGELTRDFFTLETNGKLIYQNPSSGAPQNSETATTAEVIASFPNHLFKAELVSDGKYRVCCYDTKGTAQGSWLGNYLNIPPTGGVLFFGASESTQYGQDGQDLGLWTITKEEDGFVFQNVGNTEKYMGGASSSDSKVYFTCKNRYSDMTYTRTNSTVGKFLTICLPYSATISGATVYTLQGVDNKTTPTKAYLTEVDGGTIEAGKGYILKTTAASDVTATLDATSTATAVTANAGLTGVFFSTKATADTYVLSGNKWLKVVADNEPTIGANRAYLNISEAAEVAESPARSITLDFDGIETSGINTVNSEEGMVKSSEMYNLSGQRISHPTKGIYVRNGKKVFIK